MAVTQKKSDPMAGSIPEEIIHWIRSEPALAWFTAQALWMAQPALEIFLTPDSITAIAESLESTSRSAGDPPARPEEGGT